MNWLAHVLLAGQDGAHRLGSVLPDVVPPRARAGFPARMQEGMAAHEAMDRFTDAHPAIAAMRALVPVTHRRYAGVVVDCVAGHLLARDWATWCPVPLGAFTREVYAQFAALAPGLPAPVPQMIAGLTTHDGLGAYATVAGVEATLARMSARLERRFARPVRMQDAVAPMLEEWPRLAAAFGEFFPALAAHMAQPHYPSATFTRGGNR